MVEANNRAGDMLGFERLLQIMREGPTLNAKALHTHLKEAILKFTAGTDQHDDLTIVVGQV